jgi:hypothetical protein
MNAYKRPYICQLLATLLPRNGREDRGINEHRAFGFMLER